MGLVVLLEDMHQELELGSQLRVLEHSLNYFGVFFLFYNQQEEVGERGGVLLLGKGEVEGKVEFGEFVANVEGVGHLIERMVPRGIFREMSDQISTKKPSVRPPDLSLLEGIVVVLKNVVLGGGFLSVLFSFLIFSLCAID